MPTLRPSDQIKALGDALHPRIAALQAALTYKQLAEAMLSPAAFAQAEREVSKAVMKKFRPKHYPL